MIFRSFFTLAILSGWLLLAGRAGADVFDLGGTRDTATGSWTGLASVEFVPVGDAGNLADADTTYGRVDYAYSIGKYDVTAAQYTEFLNAVAKQSDPYGLYDSNMNVITNGGGCNIVRSQQNGKDSYSVAADWANRPVNFVSWADAARFCNWLQNGQKTGNEDDSTTEKGAYALNGAKTDDALLKIIRNPDAQYFIPSLNEWYKAAYYDPNRFGAGQPGYWLTPLKHDTGASNILDPNGTNNANFYDYLLHTQTIGRPYYRTEVGAFAASPGPYGTYDQGGNVDNLAETVVNTSYIRLFGTDFASPGAGMSKWAANAMPPATEYSTIGFRIGAIGVPEPGICVLIITSAIAGILFWRRKQ